MEQLNSAKLELENLHRIRNEGSFMRSKVKWIEQGEKPSKYFLQNEHRKLLKQIHILEKGDGTQINKQDELLQIVRDYYQKLYKTEDCTQIDLENLFSDIHVPRLGDDIASTLEGELTYDQVLEALKKMKNNKSPV